MLSSVLHCKTTRSSARLSLLALLCQGVNTCDEQIHWTSGTSHPAAVVDGIERRNLLRLMLATGAIAMGPLAFAQTGGSPKRGGRLTIGADADPIGLDPVTVAAFSSFDFTSLIYTGLLRWNADMKVEPDLAVGYEQPNDTTYVFRLRSGVKFHNGQTWTPKT